MVSEIPETRWESFKPVILDKQRLTMSIDDLARYMNREHKFSAK
jgi:hypothetical protein